MRNTIPTRVDKEFRKLLDDSKLNRIKIGKDNPLKPSTDGRMTLAISRLFKKYPRLKGELVSSDFK